MKKLILIIFLILSTQVVISQCAMCKAVVEGGNKEIAEGVNNGITYLMIFPYVLVGALAYLLIRYKRKTKN